MSETYFSVSGLVPLFMTIVGEEVVVAVLLFICFSFRFEVGKVGFEGGEYTLGGGNSLLCLIRH